MRLYHHLFIYTSDESVLSKTGELVFHMGSDDIRYMLWLNLEPLHLFDREWVHGRYVLVRSNPIMKFLHSFSQSVYLPCLSIFSACQPVFSVVSSPTHLTHCCSLFQDVRQDGPPRRQVPSSSPRRRQGDDGDQEGDKGGEEEGDGNPENRQC